MSLDKSLKTKGALERHRNVLTRTERIEKLKEEGHWSEDDAVFGLPKIVHRKSVAGAKDKKETKAEEGAEGIESEAPKEGEAPKT